MTETHTHEELSDFVHGQISAYLSAMKQRITQLESTVSFITRENASLWVEVKRAEVLFAETEKRVADRFHAQQVALDKAEHALSLRLEAMNEFRDQITRERALYVTRDQLDLSIKVLASSISPLQSSQSFLRGRDAAIIGIIGLLAGIAAAAFSVVLKLWK